MTKEQIENTKWAKEFKKDDPISYPRAMRYALETPLFVDIYKNRETGILLYSIVVRDSDFWMESFYTRKEAIKLCSKMGWSIQEH